MRQRTFSGRWCFSTLLAVLALWLTVAPRPAEAACSLTDLYSSISNGATDGAAFLKEHPGCGAHMANPVYWIVVGAVSVSLMHAKEQVTGACAEIQDANEKIAKKLKDAADDASKIDGWMKTLGFSDEARNKVQAVFGDVLGGGGDIGGLADFLSCTCATVLTAGMGEIVKFGNDCVVAGICVAQEWLDDVLNQGGGSCKPHERPVEMLECTIATDPSKAIKYPPGGGYLNSDGKGFWFTTTSSDPSIYSGSACYCPPPMQMVSAPYDKNLFCDGFECDICRCPKGQHGAGTDPVTSRICLCDSDNQLPDGNGACAPPKPPEKPCKCSGNLIATKVKNSDGSTSCNCGCGANQDLIGGTCVSACAVPSHIKIAGGVCCAPSQVSSCGSCCTPGLKPDPVSGSCISALTPTPPKGPLSPKQPKL